MSELIDFEVQMIEDELSGFTQLVEFLESRPIYMNTRGMTRDEVLACGAKFANAPRVRRPTLQALTQAISKAKKLGLGAVVQ